MQHDRAQKGDGGAPRPSRWAPSEVARLRVGPPVALAQGLVVLSPHCDDAVLSVGAILARHTRSGGRATVVTVLSNDPTSTLPASSWDAQAGFSTHGEAAVARAREDALACSAVGADSVHLGAHDEQYRRGYDADVLWADIAPRLHQADEIWLPGYPLVHRDHRLVAELVVSRMDPAQQVRLYLEEPYARRLRRGDVPKPTWQSDTMWSGLRATAPEAGRKVRALTHYWSQIELLSGARGVYDPRGAYLLVQIWRAARSRGEWVSAPLPAGRLAEALGPAASV